MALEYQSDTYNGTDRGSYRFTDPQRKAWRLMVDVEILSYVSQGYVNTKPPQDRGHWGYAHLLHGTSLYTEFKLEYPRTRVLDVTNWVQITAQLDRRRSLWTNAMFEGVPDFDLTRPEPPEIFEVWALPETILKVKLDSPGAFQINVWWLERDLLEEYGEEQPTDSSDPTDGLDEYPDPEKRPDSDPYPDGFSRDFNDPANDPDDYPDEFLPEPEPGSEPGRVYLVSWTWFDEAIFGNQGMVSFSVIGPITGTVTTQIQPPGYNPFRPATSQWQLSVTSANGTQTATPGNVVGSVNGPTIVAQ